MDIRIHPDSVPSANPSLLQRLALLLTRAAAMGLLPGERIASLDAATLRRVFSALQRHRIFSTAAVDVAPLLRVDPAELGAAEAKRLEAVVERLIEALEESPTPASEWTSMRALFGDDLLARLLGVSGSSLRRYASTARATPQPVAERLHWLAMVVADLAGAYNDFGIRRWFERPRAQLDGASPRLLLGDDWHVDDDAAKRVRALAAALSGAQALAV